MFKKIFFLTVFFFLPIPFLFSALSKNSSSQKFFQNGLALKEQGQLADAEQQFKKALDREPANADYHFELANIYAMRHDLLGNSRKNSGADEMLSAAARELEQAVMLRPDFIAARYNLGVVYKRSRKFEIARQQFQEILVQDSSQISAQMQLGSVYEDQGFYDEAEDAYRKAREMDRANPDIEIAIEDLKRHRSSAEQHGNMESQLAMLDHTHSAFQRSPYEPERESANSRGSALQQALPYVGSLLVQQFMKARGNKES